MLISGILLCFCQPKKKVGEGFTFEDTEPTDTQSEVINRVDLASKGVVPVQQVQLEAVVDEELALEGQTIFELKCAACHKIEDRFMGPAMEGVTKRRSPEWILNMILNPNQMVSEDSLAMELFIAFDGMPMSNMGLSESEARAVLEYFRSIDQEGA